MIPVPALWAQAISTTRFELTRISQLSEWWHWALLAAICLLVVALVVWMYRRDTRELAPGVAISLAGLRLLALLGLLFTFLALEKRTEREVVQNSRLIMLLDASQSMGLEDAEASSTGADRRIDLVVRELSQGTLLKDLRQKHDLVVMRFDESEQPVELASYTKLPDEAGPQVAQRENAVDRLGANLATARNLYGVAAGLVAVAILLTLVYFFSRNPAAAWPSAALLVGVVLLTAGVLVAAVTNLRYPQISLAAVVGNETLADLRERMIEQSVEDAPKREAPAEPTIDWQEELTPGGNETRLGEALMAVVNRQRGGPVAGMVLVSDGRNNAGLPYTDAVTLAQEAEIPVYTVGMGSNRRPVNVAMVDMEAPARVYPGDAFSITGFVQAFGMDERPAKVELVSYPYGQDEQNRQVRFEDDRNIRLGRSGELVPVQFDVEPDEEAGRRVYVLRIEPPPSDHNVRDNQRQATVQIVDRRTKVLLLAGGPTREYRFLRNQLYRDRDTIVHVLLQTGRPGISQEANDGDAGIHFQFPEDADELFQYDCIVAFDPDWQALDDDQVRLLERWVDKQAGGLIVVAGPVYTPRWAAQRRGDLLIDVLKGLYPVVFYNRGTSLGLGRFGSEETSRLEFTREGLESEFLWLGDSASESQHAWAGFEGVYGYYAVKDVKPGATIYAHFINEAESVGGEMPVYLAGHFYGAGRVFFLASGELWRIRQLDPAYFEMFYTKLIRHVSEGRLLRDSKRGVLMVERSRYKIGDAVNVQARLSDAQHQPLKASDTPEVSAIVRRPDGSQAPLKLSNVNLGGGELAGREGIYAGQFPALQIGQYEVQLTVPGSGGEEILTQPISVRAPRKEIEQPERNDPLLFDLAERTGGLYFNGIAEAAGRGQVASLAAQVEPHDRLTPLPDLPDKRFERRLMWWQLGLIAGALCLEWLIRRMSKLA